MILEETCARSLRSPDRENHQKEKNTKQGLFLPRAAVMAHP